MIILLEYSTIYLFFDLHISVKYNIIYLISIIKIYTDLLGDKSQYYWQFIFIWHDIRVQLLIILETHLWLPFSWPLPWFIHPRFVSSVESSEDICMSTRSSYPSWDLMICEDEGFALAGQSRTHSGAGDVPASCIAHAAEIARDARILSALVTRDASGTILSRSSRLSFGTSPGFFSPSFSLSLFFPPFYWLSFSFSMRKLRRCT